MSDPAHRDAVAEDEALQAELEYRSLSALGKIAPLRETDGNFSMMRVYDALEKTEHGELLSSEQRQLAERWSGLKGPDFTAVNLRRFLHDPKKSPGKAGEQQL